MVPGLCSCLKFYLLAILDTQSYSKFWPLFLRPARSITGGRIYSLWHYPIHQTSFQMNTERYFSWIRAKFSSRSLMAWHLNTGTNIATYYYYYYYYYNFLVSSQAFLSWYFSSWFNGDPSVQASSFRLQYWMFYVWRSKYGCFCTEFIEYFPVTASTFFFKPFVTLPVAPAITSIITHFMFHIRFISIHKLLLFLVYFLLPFAWNFCPRELPHLSAYIFYLFCF